MMIQQFRRYTVSQLIIAAGIGRHLQIGEISRVSDTSKAYIYKLQNDADYIAVVSLFKMMPLDDDIKEYKGLGTLMMMVGQMMYNLGEKEKYKPNE